MVALPVPRKNGRVARIRKRGSMSKLHARSAPPDFAQEYRI